ncbi:MAG: hypothetical protein KatS3mg105_2952 [Gemmatales bacterium]|nr:MAG: hypothetical protein KatS3mg105_2952 [Gemmatales bacterium]
MNTVTEVRPSGHDCHKQSSTLASLTSERVRSDFAPPVPASLSAPKNFSPKGWVRVNPVFQGLLKANGLHSPEDFLALPMVIVSGHPNRHVGTLSLSGDGGDIRVFLKKEHRVCWRDRLANWLAGYGFVSGAIREARLLDSLGDVPAPQWLAAGEDGRGRAFVMIRELANAIDLRTWLRVFPDRHGKAVRRVARSLARLHNEGVVHRDLFCKHVFLTEDGTVYFVDWQRAKRCQRPSTNIWCQDLAALHATLPDDAIDSRYRLIFLKTYLRYRSERMSFADVRREVAQQTAKLLQKRYIREIRQCTVRTGEQTLLWLDGVTLCLTQPYYDELDGVVPDWLARWGQTTKASGFVYRRCCRFGRWLMAWIRCKPYASDSLQQAALLFHLQRYGIRTPELMAVGQRRIGAARFESFLLTRRSERATGLKTWLERFSSAQLLTAERKLRWSTFDEVGKLLRKLHEAGITLGKQLPLAVSLKDGSPVLGIDDVAALRRHRRCTGRIRCRDLAAVLTALKPFASRTDLMRVRRGYRAAQ